ncbi:MAG: hypothetical protein A2494_01675 [Candidatus Lloydbacteria bacterium RIFOXYC12_FULL_46_25]|uniref:Uncharacterized protein n=1 Tax=Candidatus Lloydbacteria bacterium RIFOXYC12_FULL_46_25 TaxID=1798670 RepID=A0A1G2DT92_9BACT|nr:MAG: hypothetical protein A2494_01675 [Candidatus Lloydbacteria bacterium RIFOXYC12_FULL_46_25]
MSALSILLVVIYGVFVIGTFLSYVLLTVAMYEENVGNVLDDSEDILDVFHVIPRMLGEIRFLLLCVMAIAWPISYTFFILICLPSRGATFKEFPLITQRILLWFFLGFGKFAPTPGFVRVTDDHY